MPKVDFNERLYVNYHAGRAHDESVMRLWRDVLRRVVGERRGLSILDLGAGTGRFSTLLAEEFDSRVVGVEPADKMRAVAEAQNRDARVTFLKGAAEQIPLPDDSCDAAWLSQIVHHINDLDAAAQELRRVLKDDGLIVIRSNFGGRLDGFCRYYDYFPTGLAVDEERLPAVETVESHLGRQGFRLARFETVEQMEARSLSEYAERIRQRTYSTFELISEEEFQAGLAALAMDSEQEETPQPVTAKVDVLVFTGAG